ncbi:MAG: cytochrome c [Desulfobacteraceae bacterium]|nr:cytochrome c [Desulfobacteraceae bacterium]
MIRRIAVLAVLAAVALTGIWGVVTIYDNNMSYWRMWETPAVRPHEQPIFPMEAGVVPFSGGEAILRAKAASGNLQPPFDQADKKIIAAGRTAYGYYCDHCHGNDYDGMGTVGQSFAPMPADLRSLAVQNMPAGQMFASISYGTPNGRQPPLQATMTPAERWHTIAFVQSLGTRETRSRK